METVTRKGKKFVLVPAEQWERLASGAVAMPRLPQADEAGNRPAVAFARAAIARGIIRDRTAAGWSQAELARRAGLRVETLNRIERAKVTPDTATIAKIDRALRTGKPTRRRPVLRKADAR